MYASHLVISLFQSHRPMTMNFWEEHFTRLQKSLVAQIERIRSGSAQTTIKGTSIEVVLRRVLAEYLPGYFSVRPGQIANNKGALSPQQDIIVYDGNAFPHLAVNEDSSVIVCCESVLATVECKTYWNQKDVEEHYTHTIEVEDEWHHKFYGRNLLAGYFVLFHEPKTPNLDLFKQKQRSIGIYCLKNNNSWSRPFDMGNFQKGSRDSLQTFFQDLLKLCMDIGQIELGSFTSAYAALASYIGWEDT